MPRKRKQEKRTITVIVNGKPIAVTMYPPKQARQTWYAFWVGLNFAKSTGHVNFDDAVIAAQEMVKGGGKKSVVADAVLSDAEFEAIQRAHYARKTDPAAKLRAAKTLEDCLDCINAFKAITGLDQLAKATPDDCARFQTQALRVPKNWRHLGRVKSAEEQADQESIERMSPNTVIKWSRTLAAAFERANRMAYRRKCVRGVVEQSKLLNSNPWTQFTWIEGTRPPIRQFAGADLLSFLTFLETRWREVGVGIAAAKVFLWSSCRKLEVASLKWDALRIVGDEYHFQIEGKWGVERWFRVPEPVHRELLAMKTDNPFVFAAYNDQLRQHHADNPNALRFLVDKFKPKDFGRWFYQRVRDWSSKELDEPAFVHMFRKTTLQYARRGEDINRQVASDARVSESVMMTNYVRETDEELRQKSNRTYNRIVASLRPDVAERYGYAMSSTSELEKRLEAAISAKNWDLAQALSTRLAQERRAEAVE